MLIDRNGIKDIFGEKADVGLWQKMFNFAPQNKMKAKWLI